MTALDLEAYRRKRDVGRSGEPVGKRRKSSGKQPIFVIQQHDARTLHYDFRLEIDGVLASWAVPKGPSTDPRERRLAIETEDHPLDYAGFEGTIAEGEYGAGTVLVWDRGHCRNLRSDRDLSESRAEGLIEVWLEGQKLRGGYALKRTDGGEKPRWLLIKMRDAGADARRKPTSTEPTSVISGRTLEEIAGDSK